MLNEQGGINGRKINLISLDNGYNPPKALEQTRKLVEEDNVLAIAGFLGTAQHLGAEVSEWQGTEPLPDLGRRPLQRSQELSLDRAALSYLRRPGRDLRQLHPDQASGCEDRRAQH
jgi:hypothetical protein